MISEIPIGESPTPEPPEPPEPTTEPPASVAQPVDVPPPPQPVNSVNVPQAHPERLPKRKVGRPKKENAQPTQPKAAQPKAQPKAQQPAQPAPPPFTINDMSSAQLVAELVNRRRANERTMRQELYRSWVM